jgi:2-polyprenyl-6-methoxyphenol hydroxylase-like FAD-dependent oxidoreductase
MQHGIGAFHRKILALSPWLGHRVNELESWNDVKLLTVALDRLSRWYRPGPICIGDATHAMSPIGGVGINLAIQDAVAAANVLAEPLRAGRVTENHLLRIQVRRLWPTRVTQAFQRAIQNAWSHGRSPARRNRSRRSLRLLNWRATGTGCCAGGAARCQRQPGGCH